MLDSTAQDKFSIHIMLVLMQNGMNAVRSLLLSYTMTRNRVSEYVHVIQTFIRTKDSLAVVVFIFLSFIQIEAVYLNH